MLLRCALQPWDSSRWNWSGSEEGAGGNFASKINQVARCNFTTKIKPAKRNPKFTTSAGSIWSTVLSWLSFCGKRNTRPAQTTGLYRKSGSAQSWRQALPLLTRGGEHGSGFCKDRSRSLWVTDSQKCRHENKFSFRPCTKQEAKSYVSIDR